MSILKNFVNPWESGGVLSSQVLENNVLDNKLSNNNESTKKLKIPTGYIFGNNIPVDIEELYTIRNYIIGIFKKNGLKINVKVISSSTAKTKERNIGNYEAIIGIEDKDSSGGIGLSTHVIQTSEIRSADFRIFHDGNSNSLASYVNYSKIAFTGGNSYLYKYIASYYLAHEILHQFLIKAYAYFYGENLSKFGYQSHEFGFNKEIKVVRTPEFNIHENNSINLNTDGQVLATVHKVTLKNNYTSRLRQEETILTKHKVLLKAWLGDLSSFLALQSYNYQNSEE